LLTGGDDATRIWRCGEWQTHQRELVPTRLARFSPDGRQLSIVWAPAFAAAVQVLDIETLETLRELSSWYPVLDFAYSPDGRVIGTVADGPEGTVIAIYNAASGAWTGNAHWRGDRLHGVSFSPDGRLLATAARAGGVRFWSPDQGRHRGGLRSAGGHISEFSFSPDGRWMATSAHGAVSLWDQALVGGPRSLAVAAQAMAPVVFSPSGSQVAVATAGGGVLLANAQTIAVEHRLQGHLDPVSDLAYSPDGRQLASVDGRRLCIWSTSDGRPLWQVDAHRARCVCWSPDASTLVTGGADHLLRLWDAAAATVRTTFEQGHTAPVLAVRFTADGKRVFSHGEESAVRMWDPATGKQNGKPIAPQTPLSGMAVLDSNTVAIQSLMGDATRWRYSAPESHERLEPELRWPKGHGPWYMNQPRSLVASPDGRQLARVGPGDILVADDVATGARHFSLSGQGIAPVSAAYSPDGRTLAVVGRGGELTFWDTSSFSGRRMLGSPLAAVRGLAFSPDGKSLAIATDGRPEASADGFGSFPAQPNVRLPSGSNTPGFGAGERDYVPWHSTSCSLRTWDVESEQEVHWLEHAESLTMLPAVGWSQGGNHLAAAAGDGSIWVWDASRGKIAAHWHLDEGIRTQIEAAKGRTPPLVPQNVLARIKSSPCLALSPDGLRLASIDAGGEVKLWNTTDGKAVATVPVKADEPRAVFFSPDGATLVITSLHEAHLFDPETRQLRRTLVDPEASNFLCGAYSADGGTLALGAAQGSVHCYDARSGRLTTTLVGHVDGVGALAFAPDGRTLATGGWGTTVRLWDVASQREVAVLQGHRGRVHALAFSPDGRVLATGGEVEGGLGEVFFWRAERGQAK
jgi:WD40 repeat protein